MNRVAGGDGWRWGSERGRESEGGSEWSGWGEAARAAAAAAEAGRTTISAAGELLLARRGRGRKKKQSARAGQ